MKKFIQFAIFAFLLCFISSPYTEARTVITNDVSLDFVQESHIFHFADRDIRCVGTFSPDASLDCNKHVSTNYIETSTLTLILPTFTQKYLSLQPTLIYKSFIGTYDVLFAEVEFGAAEVRSSFKVMISTIEAQIVGDQVCYFATEKEGRAGNSVDDNITEIETYVRQNQVRDTIGSTATSCVPLGVEIPPGFEKFTK